MPTDKETWIKLAVLASIVILTLATTVGIIILAIFATERSGVLLPAFLGFLTPILVGMLAILRSTWKVEDRLEHPKEPPEDSQE